VGNFGDGIMRKVSVETTTFGLREGHGGGLQRGPGGPWPTRNFGWVGHNAFGPTNNCLVCSLEKLV